MTTRLHLIRHGRPVIDPTRPAATWQLSDDTEPYRALATAEGFPRGGRWLASTELKAVSTAHRLRAYAGLGPDGVEVAVALAELGRVGVITDRSEFERAVVRSLESPRVASVPGWETAEHARRRLVGFVVDLIAAVPSGVVDDVVLVGHGTAWIVLVAALIGAPYDVSAWRELRMPDWCVIDADRTADGRLRSSPVTLWGSWARP